LTTAFVLQQLILASPSRNELLYHRLQIRAREKVVGLLAAFGAEPEDIAVGFITVESLIDPFRADPRCVSRRRSQRVKRGLKWS
jgi:hypothetical protein